MRADAAKQAGIEGTLKKLAYKEPAAKSEDKVDPEKPKDGDDNVGKAKPKSKPKRKSEDKTARDKAQSDISYKGKIVILKIGTEDLSRSSWFDFTERTMKKASDDGAEGGDFRHGHAGRIRLGRRPS